MNTLKISILLLAAITLFSCQKDEDVKPATNPRFSVAQVQEIGMQGIEVGANIYEYGTDEIKEYGFVISSYPNPRVQPLATIKKAGKPEQYFELVITAALQKGTTYYVESFVITENLQVYSETISYISTGTGGFIVENFGFKPRVYFGDTVEVTGTEFTVEPNSMKVEIFNEEMPFLPNTKNSFKFIVSDNIIKHVQNKTIEFPIRISDSKTVREFKRVVSFVDPVFEIKPTQGVDWNDTLMITGNFLKSVVSQIMYDGEIVPILSSGEWGFKVPVYTEFSKKKEPNVVARIRGELYDLGKLFSINPTKIAPGQTVNFKPHQPQIIKGENFAPFLEGFNHLVDETGDSIPYYLSTFPTENELSIVFFENTIFEKRLTSVRIRNFDLLSENSFNVLNTSPFAPVVKYSSDIWAYDQKSVTIGETGYFYSDGKLYNVSLNGTFNRGFKMNLPSNLSQRFFFNQFGGKIYTGGGIDEQLIDSHAFYAIDPATNSIQRLADIPKEVTWMSRIYQLQGDLIFEGGMRRTEEGELVLSSARYRYKLDSDSWEKIDEGAEPIQSTYYYSQDLVFNHNNQIFAIQQREYGSQIRLQKLNTNDLVWETLNTYQTNGSIFSNEPMIIDGKAFIQLPGELIQVNLQNSEIRGYSSIFQNYSWSTSRVPSFYFNKKGYFHIYNLLVEFDPAYLD